MSIENEKAKPNPAPWHIRADYGRENVYRLWDENDNYHDDCSPETMDANARLIAAAPDMLAALKAIAEQANAAMLSDGDTFLSEADIFTLASDAISKAEGGAR